LNYFIFNLKVNITITSQQIALAHVSLDCFRDLAAKDQLLFIFFFVILSQSQIKERDIKIPLHIIPRFGFGLIFFYIYKIK
jgi:hypothetical protein